MNRFSKFAKVLIAVVLLVSPANGLAAGTDAEQFVKERHGQLVAKLQQPKSTAREKSVGVAIDEVFDYRELAARSLGDEWKKRSEAEQQQFRELLEQLVRQSYRKSIDNTLGYQVEFRGTRNVGGDTVVSTVAKHKSDSRKAPVAIDYVLTQSDGKWRAVDIVVEGSSLVGNYRSQFTRVIRKSGFADLVAKMKRKIEKGEK